MRYRDSYCHIVNFVFTHPVNSTLIAQYDNTFKIHIRKENMKLDMVSL